MARTATASRERAEADTRPMEREDERAARRREARASSSRPPSASSSRSRSRSAESRPAGVPRPQKRAALSLFWRTFFLLALLLATGVWSWVQTFRALEFEPRALQAAQQIASLVNLARAALRSTDGINRVALIKSVSKLESVQVEPREPSDRWEPYEVDRLSRAIAVELRSQLGNDTIVARTMNGV